MARSSSRFFSDLAIPRDIVRTRRVLRELIGVAAVLAFWIVLWMWAAKTLPQPWAPDPETRAALIERTETVARAVQTRGP